MRSSSAREKTTVTAEREGLADPGKTMTVAMVSVPTNELTVCRTSSDARVHTLMEAIPLWSTPLLNSKAQPTNPKSKP